MKNETKEDVKTPTPIADRIDAEWETYVPLTHALPKIRQLERELGEALKALEDIVSLPAHPMRKKGVEIARAILERAKKLSVN